MVGAPAAADAVERARALPNLRVGLHIVLVDGEPVTDPAQIPALIGGSGRFRNDLARYGAQIALHGSVRRQVAKEITAQFEAYQATGLPLDHVNAPPAFPSASGRRRVDHDRRAALRHAGTAHSGRAMADRRGNRSAHARRVGRIVAPWASWLRRRVRRAGLTTADAVFGLAWSGAMTRTRARRAAWPAASRLRRNLPASRGHGCLRRRGAGLPLCRGIRGAVRSRLHRRRAPLGLRARRLLRRLTFYRRRFPSRYPAARNQWIASSSASR